MFENTGRKVKKLSEVINVIGIIASIVIGIIVMQPGDIMILIGLVVIALGCVFSWIGSVFLYGYGQLIENSDKLVWLHTGKNIEEFDSENIKTDLPTEDLNEEEKLKRHIENVLSEESKPQEILDVYRQYKKYVYGFYPEAEVKTALEAVIKMCEENEIEGNSQLMIEVCKRKILK